MQHAALVVRRRPRIQLRRGSAVAVLAQETALAALALHVGVPGPPGQPGAVSPVEAEAFSAIAAGAPCRIRSDGRAAPAAAGAPFGETTVVGLARAAAGAGFTVELARDELTLPDWTAAAGSASLVVGAVYWLGTAGGLALAPPGSGAAVRLGVATGAQTLALFIEPPIRL